MNEELEKIKKDIMDLKKVVLIMNVAVLSASQNYADYEYRKTSDMLYEENKMQYDELLETFLKDVREDK